MPENLKWEEVRSIMSEVQELFAGREDVNTVEEVQRLQAEIREGLQAKEDKTQTLIRALAAEVEETQARVDTLPASKEVDASRRAEAESRKSVSKGRVEAMEAMVHSSEDSIDHLHRQMKEVEEEATNVEQCGNEQGHDRLRHAISLYGNITGVQWKYEDDKHHLLQGYASVPDLHEVRSFTLDCTKESKYTIANKLWDIIDPPSSPPSPPTTITA